MARREVMEVVCDRCGRKETQDRDQVSDELEAEFTFHGETVKFEDLCHSCRGAVENYFNKLARKKEDKPGAKVTPIESAPPPVKRGLLGR